MARETRAQREAREAAESQVKWEEFRADYPRRFAKLLYDFTVLAASEVYFEGERFVVEHVDTMSYRFDFDYLSKRLDVTVPEDQHWEILYSLEVLEGKVLAYYDAQEQEQRKDMVRRAALNKLSSEERELLGL